MSNPIENERRVDGEFHYAMHKGTVWAVYRLPGGEFVESFRGSKKTAEQYIEWHDKEARHWIEHTQAQNQELLARQRAEDQTAWLNAFLPLLPEEKREQYREQIRVAQAAPQVSEGSEAAGELIAEGDLRYLPDGGHTLDGGYLDNVLRSRLTDELPTGERVRIRITKVPAALSEQSEGGDNG